MQGGLPGLSITSPLLRRGQAADAQGPAASGRHSNDRGIARGLQSLIENRIRGCTTNHVCYLKHAAIDSAPSSSSLSESLSESLSGAFHLKINYSLDGSLCLQVAPMYVQSRSCRIFGKRPQLKIGQFYCIMPVVFAGAGRDWLDAYDAPAPYGTQVDRLISNSIVGPVEEYVHSDEYACIRVENDWINVWRATGGANWGTNNAYCVGLSSSEPYSWLSRKPA